ncbi:ABC transporter ATP-binding protein [Streptosporangium sp. NPDC049046]|uniref:ABC transporter ATP-binding protein n=1 Tax=unclassified Streptosporangium TaxID=2632669 RepID=UPI00344AD120
MPEHASRLLDVDDLTIGHSVGGEERILVDGVDLHVDLGETIGIVGESGSGKSLSVRSLLQLLPAGFNTTGSAQLGGINVLTASERDMRRVRGRQASMILQDPFTMLNPLMRVGHHLEEVLREKPQYRAMSKAERRAEVQRRLEEVGITDPAVSRRYPFQLSGGMRQRVGIAATLATDPDMIIADEPTTALDTVTQQEILKLLISIQRQRRMSMIMITHDLRVAFAACDRVYVMYAGAMMEAGPSDELSRSPRHPYTLGLLASEPPLGRRLARLPVIKGELPHVRERRIGCRFAERCEWATPDCSRQRVQLVQIDDDRASACIRVDEIRRDLDARFEIVEKGEQLAAPQDVSAPVVVSLEGVSKEYGHGNKAVAALKEVSLTVRQGQAVALVGESGSGKTTLGRCLVGLESITSGAAEVFGIDITQGSRMSRSDLRTWRSKVQYVFQDPYSSLNPRMTVGQTLAEAGRQAALSGDPRVLTVAEVLERVGLRPHYAARRPAALSGGERQRIAIGRALALNPELLICDEPVSALDVSVQAQVLNLLNDIRRETGIALLFITHDLAVVRQVADTVYVLEKGRVVEAGTAEIMDSPNSGYTKQLLEAVPRTSSDWLGKHSQMGQV